MFRNMRITNLGIFLLKIFIALSLLSNSIIGCGGGSSGDDGDGGLEFTVAEGEWEGTTGSGRSIGFEVSGGQVINFYIETPTETHLQIITNTLPAIINSDMTFTSTGIYTYEGKFESRTTCAGTWLGGSTWETTFKEMANDGNGDETPDTENDLDSDGFTEIEGDCDDTDANINPDSDETCNDNIDNDCDGDTDYDDDDCGGEVPQTFSVYSIPDADINIDGNDDDWNELEPVFVDDIDDQFAGADVDGSDLHKLYLAKDDMYLYIMIMIWDGPPITDIRTNYIFEANEFYGVPLGPNDYRTWSTSNLYSVEGWWAIAGINENTYNEYDQSNIGTGANFIEWRILLPEKDALNDKWVSAVVHVFGCDEEAPDCNLRPVNDDHFPLIQINYEPNLSPNIDDDGDGFTANDGDCDDTDEDIYPGAVEVECDGIDQDCDGSDLCSAFQITEARWTGEGDKFDFGFTVEDGEITSSTILINNPAPGIAYTIAGWGGAEITNNTFFFMDYVNNYGTVTVNGTFTSASTCTLEVNHETFEAIPIVH